MKVILLTSIASFLFAFSLQAQELVEGKIITHAKDSIACKILKYKKRSQEAELAYKEVQVQDETGAVKTFYPTDIAGYIKEGVVYRSMNTSNPGFPELKLFMQRITSGKVELYTNPAYGKFFFRKSNEKEFTMLNSTYETKVEE
jgi:hypothetical protein